MIEYAYISFPEDIGQVVREARKEQGWSQTELAQRSGCSQRFVSECERGKPGAEIGKVLQLLQALGLTLRVVSKRSPAQNRELVEQGINRIEESLGQRERRQRRLSDYLEMPE